MTQVTITVARVPFPPDVIEDVTGSLTGGILFPAVSPPHLFRDGGSDAASAVAAGVPGFTT